MEYESSVRGKWLHLLGISFLSLFLEMALIRYINSTVQVIAYFNNFLILSAFLGLGFGSLLVRYRLRMFRYFPLVFLAVVALVTWLDQFGCRRGTADLVVWLLPTSNEQPTLPASAMVFIVFFANFLFFVPLGERLGWCLDLFESRLVAYSLDLGGSILGVIGFGIMSFLQTPPLLWFSLAGVLVLALLLSALRGRALIAQGIPALLLLGLAALCPLLPQQGRWSPYYKVTYVPYWLDSPEVSQCLGYAISVDKLRIQDALYFSPALDQSVLHSWLDYYRLPYHFRDPGRVLVLGGGSGNDATIALREGATEVDVVEIDPIIASLGYSVHPHQPYKDPRVRLFNDDARAFLRRSHNRYDLIAMNALDSHYQAPGLSTLRLESYMYTVEAFQDARRLMKPDGIFVVHLSSTREWMGRRLFWSLTEAFGKPPRLFMTADSPFASVAFCYGPPGVLSTDRFPDAGGLAEISPDAFAGSRSYTSLATDDWPHLYLAARRLPLLYMSVLAVIVLVTFGLFRSVGAGSVTSNLHMLLLGAGFMLLETRSITKAAMLFGSTWIVNAVVIGGILLLIFLGNLLVMRNLRPSKAVCYGGLFLSLALGYLVPINFILESPFWARMPLAAFWMGLPIFFASLIFSTSFKTTPNAASAFGSNLLGVVIGGVLEYSSMVLGLNVLYLLAMLIYAMALVADRPGFAARDTVPEPSKTRTE